MSYSNNNVSHIVHKYIKYNTKLQENPNSYVYKKKYIYYREQIGGVLGSLIEGAIRIGVFCRASNIVSKDLSSKVARANTLGAEELVKETGGKLGKLAREAIKKFDEKVSEGIYSGETKIRIDKTINPQLEQDLEQSLMHYALSPNCPLTDINIKSTGSENIALELSNHLGKLAKYSETLSQTIKPKLLSAQLSSDAIKKLREIYLNID